MFVDNLVDTWVLLMDLGCDSLVIVGPCNSQYQCSCFVYRLFYEFQLRLKDGPFKRVNSYKGRTLSNGTVACSTEFLSLSKLKIETEQDQLVSFGLTLLYFEVC